MLLASEGKANKRNRQSWRCESPTLLQSVPSFHSLQARPVQAMLYHRYVRSAANSGKSPNPTSQVLGLQMDDSALTRHMTQVRFPRRQIACQPNWTLRRSGLCWRISRIEASCSSPQVQSAFPLLTEPLRLLAVRGLRRELSGVGPPGRPPPGLALPPQDESISQETECRFSELAVSRPLERSKHQARL